MNNQTNLNSNISGDKSLNQPKLKKLQDEQQTQGQNHSGKSNQKQPIATQHKEISSHEEFGDDKKSLKNDWTSQPKSS